MNELGVFAQDRWTAGKMTVNAGLRFDYFTTSFPAYDLGPGTWVPNRKISFPESSFYNFKDFQPRIGVSYDLFGERQAPR